MPLQFPVTAKQFHLRYDFPIECGFVDLLREPLSPEKVLHLCKRDSQEFSAEMVEIVNATRALYRLKRFYRYSVGYKPGTLELRAAVQDGVSSLWAPVEGLYADLLERVRFVIGQERGDRSILFPEERVQATTEWLYGKFAVVHDVERSLGAILASQASSWYLEDNPDAKV